MSMWGRVCKDPTPGAHVVLELMVQRQTNSRAGLLQRVKTRHLLVACGRKGPPAYNHLSQPPNLYYFYLLVLGTESCYSNEGILKKE